MKILFVGVLDVEWSTNVEMKKALEQLGHHVEDFNYRTIAEERTPAWQCNRFYTVFLAKCFSLLRRFDGLPCFLTALYYRILGRNQMNRLLLEKVKKTNYDLVLFTKTESVCPEVIRQISNLTKTWYYFMDPMDQARRINARRYALNSDYSSATFSDVYKEFLEANPRSFWMTQGIDIDLFRQNKEIEKTIDVFFAGTKTGKRQEWIKAIRKRGIEVVCFGEGWPNGPVYHEDLVTYYQKSRIVLNLCREGSGFSVRVFQVMGSGPLLLSEYCSDLNQIFANGKHLDWASSKDELADKVAFYLRERETAEGIAAEGCSYVHQEKNWIKLMDKLVGKTARGDDL